MVSQEKIEIFFAPRFVQQYYTTEKLARNQRWHFVLPVALLIFIMLSMEGSKEQSNGIRITNCSKMKYHTCSISEQRLFQSV